jgi:hypothetical protein
VELDGSTLQYLEGSVGSAITGACLADVDMSQSNNFGEIVSVTADQGDFLRTGNGRSPDARSCLTAAEDYLDWPDRTWTPVAVRTVRLLGPDASQYVSGQRWVACAIIPPEDDRYQGSIRDDANRSAADVFGQCRSSGASAPTRVPCGEPHDLEIFGTAAVTDPAAVDGSCASMLAAVTGILDLTAGGQLEVQIVADRSLGQRSCAVHTLGNQLLQESLMGWGSAPLPLS